MPAKIVCAALLCITTTAFAQTADSDVWTALSLSTCRVDEFHRQFPNSDGRGVVVAVLDTGVDPTIPGLTHTPDGQVKVIDVQDFTGQGDIELHRVRTNPDGLSIIEKDGDGVEIAYALPELSTFPNRPGEERWFWFGSLDERRFVNSGVKDLNQNGADNDKFGICVTALSGDGDDQAVAFIDTNVDRSFADERPLQNYKLKFDTFTLFRTKPESQIVPLAFAVNIFLRQDKIVIHFDDGAHGTHVAGIAAGYQINGQKDFNGIAPGAKVISLKIGNNSLGGISTTESKKRAFEYAARFAEEHGVPVVCNLSYGVDSTVEGHSDIDRVLDEGLRRNPYVVFCSSAGNAGPGLSTMGTPAAANAIITVGALQAADTGRDVRGFDMKEAVVTPFSARGGEVAKPDIVTPGWSTSTVPRYVREGDYWSGTSMASPYAAGICAALISHVQQQHPGERVRRDYVKRALMLTAKRMDGWTALDQGFGIPDLPAAAEWLSKHLAESKDDPIIGYAISTNCPSIPGGRGESAYWRAPYFPTADPQDFSIRPLFFPGGDAASHTEFSRRFELRSRTPWCKLTQHEIYLRGEQDANVYVSFDASALTQPGLYVGEIEALWNGEVAFRLLNTIVVPYVFTAANKFETAIKDGKATGWTPTRHFFSVPPGASAMVLRLSVPEGVTSRADAHDVFDPRGHEKTQWGLVLNTENNVREAEVRFVDQLFPGVWEVDVYAPRPDRVEPYELGVRFFGLHADPAKVTSWDGGKEKAPGGKITVTQVFSDMLPGRLEGSLEGFRESVEETFEGLKDEVSRSVTLGPDDGALRLEFEMSEPHYAETTDIAVQILDGDGRSLHTASFNNHRLTTQMGNPSPGQSSTLTVKVTAGFAATDLERKTPIKIKLDRLLASPIGINVTRGGSANVDFIPSVPITVDYSLHRPLPARDDNFKPIGHLRVLERGSNHEALRIPIEIGP